MPDVGERDLAPLRGDVFVDDALVAHLARAGQVAAAGEPIHYPGTGQQLAVGWLNIEALQLGHLD